MPAVLDVWEELYRKAHKTEEPSGLATTQAKSKGVSCVCSQQVGTVGQSNGGGDSDKVIGTGRNQTTKGLVH